MSSLGPTGRRQKVPAASARALGQQRVANLGPASEELFHEAYPFLMSKAAVESTGDVSTYSALSVLSAANFPTCTLDTLQSLPTIHHGVDEAEAEPPKSAQRRVTVPPAWGLHALIHLGFKVHEFTGTGEDGTAVRRCEMVPDGSTVAVKCLASRDPERRGRFRNEYEILKGLSHNCVLKVESLIDSRFDMWLCAEYCERTVQAHVDELGPVRPDISERGLPCQLIQGVSYLHNRAAITHRDLRPSSLLLKRDSRGDLQQLRIGGFSRARRLGGRVRLACDGTLDAYVAPEVWLGRVGMEEPADIWALGMCLCFMYLGQQRMPIPFHDVISVNFFLTVGMPRDSWASIDTKIEAMLRACLAPQPDDRPDVSDLGVQ